MATTPEGAPDITSLICACGNPVAAHKCPSSMGAAPRQPKTASCRACGEKAHQNLEKTTVALECLYRQWAKATGQLSVTPSNRLVMPDVTAHSIHALWNWLVNGMVGAQTATLQPDGSFSQPDTAAVLKRMQARAESAAPMPDEQPTAEEAAAMAELDDNPTLTVPARLDDTGDWSDMLAAPGEPTAPAGIMRPYTREEEDAAVARAARLVDDFDPTDLTAPMPASELPPPPEMTTADISDIF